MIKNSQILDDVSSVSKYIFYHKYVLNHDISGYCNQKYNLIMFLLLLLKNTMIVLLSYVWKQKLSLIVLFKLSGRGGNAQTKFKSRINFDIFELTQHLQVHEGVFS